MLLKHNRLSSLRNALSLYFERNYSHNTKVLPFEAVPGPKRIPFLGILNDVIQLGNANKLPDTISKHHRKYGSIFRIRIGATDAIFVNSPDLMRNIFLFEGRCPKHPLPESWIYYNKKHNCKRGLFFMEDEEWSKYRKILNQVLLRDYIWSKEPIIHICDKAITELKHMMARQKETEKEENEFYVITQLEEFLYKWSIEVILSLMLGKSYDEKNSIKLKEIVEKFSQTVYKIFQFSSQLMTIPPDLADRLQLKAWKEFERVVPETLDLAFEIIKMAMDDFEEGDGLLSKMQTLNISREDITRIFADFIIAAGDTTAFSTQWALYLLARDIETQNAVRNSIFDEDLESPLIRGTVRETLRLYPAAAFIGRFLATDAVIGNYTIPKNTLSLMSLYTSGRDPNNFTNPHEFQPQRWLRTNHCDAETVLKPHASIPFALGSRSCIGRKVANMQMHFLLTKIIQKFHIKLLNEKDVEIKMKMILVPSEKIQLAIKPL